MHAYISFAPMHQLSSLPLLNCKKQVDAKPAAKKPMLSRKDAMSKVASGI
jgi:hypothetical protein